MHRIATLVLISIFAACSSVTEPAPEVNCSGPLSSLPECGGPSTGSGWPVVAIVDADNVQVVRMGRALGSMKTDTLHAIIATSRETFRAPEGPVTWTVDVPGVIVVTDIGDGFIEIRPDSRGLAVLEVSAEGLTNRMAYEVF